MFRPIEYLIIYIHDIAGSLSVAAVELVVAPGRRP